MFSATFLFWVVSFSGSIAAGWWLTIRPGDQERKLAWPVALLLVLMAGLLALLALQV